MSDHQAPFFTQLGILTKRLLLRVIRRPLSELPNLIISAFFLFIYDGDPFNMKYSVWRSIYEVYSQSSVRQVGTSTSS